MKMRSLYAQNAPQKLFRTISGNDMVRSQLRNMQLVPVNEGQEQRYLYFKTLYFHFQHVHLLLAKPDDTY